MPVCEDLSQDESRMYHKSLVRYRQRLDLLYKNNYEQITLRSLIHNLIKKMPLSQNNNDVQGETKVQP